MVNKKLALPLNGNDKISFDTIELITRKKKKKIHISKLNFLSKILKKKVKLDIKNIDLMKKALDIKPLTEEVKEKFRERLMKLGDFSSL